MFYNDLPQMTFFDDADLYEIEDFAPGLTEQEVLDYYALDLREVQSLESEDYKYFTIAYKRGVSKAKHKAVDSLLKSMDVKGGSQASLAFLRTFAELWPSDSDVLTNPNGNFNFKVVLEES